MISKLFLLPLVLAADLTYWSENWLLTGICNEQDQVYDWKIKGKVPQPTWKIQPWLDQAWTIRGIEITKISGGETIWWMAGNNTIDDVMLFLGPGENHSRHDFPVGTGMPMPSKQDSTENDYIDLHGSCKGGAAVDIFYTVYYTRP